MPAISDGRAYDPRAMCGFCADENGESSGFMSVSVEPTLTTVTLIPRSARSRASPRVRPISALFDAA